MLFLLRLTNFATYSVTQNAIEMKLFHGESW